MTGPNADETLTPDHLARWSFNGTALAVLGHPVGHSLSPAMHNAALAALAGPDARFADWRYFRFDVPPEQLRDALPRFHAAGFRGLNLTVPHKVLAFDLVRDFDEAVRPIGAINTLLRTESGWRGFNTDGYGLATALASELDAPLEGAHVVLLGAGGAARGAAVECLRRRCASLAIGNRTAANLRALVDSVRPLAGAIPVRGFDPADPPEDFPEDSLVINATSAGLKPSDPPPIDLRRLPRRLKVYDMIYNPPVTPLLRQARDLGHRCAAGLGMLVHQGARSLEIWTDRKPPVEAMRSAAAKALGRA